MEKFDGINNGEGVSDRSADHHGSVDHGGLDQTQTNGSLDQDAVGIGGNGEGSPSAVANSDEVQDRQPNRVLEWPTLYTETKDHSRADDFLSTRSTSDHEVEDHSNSEDVSNRSAADHRIEHSASFRTPEVETEKEEPVEFRADQKEVSGHVESSHMSGSEVGAHKSKVNRNSQEEIGSEAGDVVQPVNGKEKRSFAAVHFNGHDLVHVDSSAGLKKDDENPIHDLNDHLNDSVPESELSVLTSDIGVSGGQGIDDLRNKDDLDNQKPGHDGFSQATATVKAIEKTEPGIITYKGRPICLAKVMQKSDAEPSLSTADLQSIETEIEQRDVKALKAVARELTNVGTVLPTCEPSHSQNGNLETETTVKTNGIELSDHMSQHNLSGSDTVERNSTRMLPSHQHVIRAENGGKVVGSPNHLEEAPKWVNSVMVTSPDEGDTFTSVQKYWADDTRSDYLLVEGKRPPSFGSCDNIGFASFRNGEARISPSPFSLSKPEDGEAQSSRSLVSVDYRSNVEDKIEERDISSLALIHHHGSSSSSVHVDYDLETVVRKQNTHDLFCPICGSDVTERIILKKRKRTRVEEDDWRLSTAMTQPGSLVEDQPPKVDGSDDETWGCLACLSFFIRRDISKEENAETAESMPVSTGKAPKVPEVERVSCFSYLQRPKQEPLVNEAPNVSEQVVGEHGDELPHKDEQSEKCECLPFFSFRSETSSSVATNTTGSPIGDFHAAEIPHKDGTSDLSASVPAFPLGSSSMYDLTPSPGVSSDQEITSFVDRPEEAPKKPPAKKPPAPEDPDRSCDCLAELLPAFSWGPVPVFTHPPSDTYEFAKIEQHEEANAVSPSGSVTQPWGEENGTCNCLPELLPAFSWGPIPVFTHPPPDTYEFAVKEHEEPSAGSPSTSETQETHAPDVNGEKSIFNCLPELLSTFSWRFPVNDTANQSLTQATTGSIQEVHTTAASTKSATCACLPLLLPAFHWGFTSTTHEKGPQEPLLLQDPHAGPVPSENSSTNPIQTPGGLEEHWPGQAYGTGKRCNCLPSLSNFSLYNVFRDHHVSAEPKLPGTEGGDTHTPLLGGGQYKPATIVDIVHTETTIAVDGATIAEGAGTAAAIAKGRTPSEGERVPSEYLKSIVHGGLDVTLVSLGVVASGAGGDAKTITVVALGLANVMFGLITHLSTIMSLFHNNPRRFQEEIGLGFVQGFLSFISFLFFGALSPITYGFTSRNATNKSPKFAATCVVALISLVLLGAAKARVKSNSAVRVISTLIVTGFVASVAGYGAGTVVAQVLEQFGFSSV